jgi:hypothetical protein
LGGCYVNISWDTINNRALSPKHIFAGDPFQIFTIAAWVFVISTLLAVFAFARAHFVKVRATHRYRTHFAPRANPRPELLAKTILIFGLAALLACLFPVQRASQVSTLTHCVSNNLIESSAAGDLEWFGRFVSDKAKISRRISARPPLGHSSYCRRRRLKILSAPTLFFDVRGSSEALTLTGHLTKAEQKYREGFRIANLQLPTELLFIADLRR